MGIGGCTVPLAAALNNEPLAATTAAGVAAVVGGAAACSLALQYYAARYVGEMSLVRVRVRARGGGGGGGEEEKGNQKKATAVTTMTLVRLSTMDFWGLRVDTDVDPGYLVPPLQNVPRELLAEMANQMFVPLDVVGSHQHILSLRHGDIRDKKRLFALLSGEDDVEMPDLDPNEEENQ